MVKSIDVPSWRLFYISLTIRGEVWSRLRPTRADDAIWVILFIGPTIIDLLQLPTLTSIISHNVEHIIMLIEGFQILLKHIFRIDKILDRIIMLAQAPAYVSLDTIISLKSTALLTAEWQVPIIRVYLFLAQEAMSLEPSTLCGGLPLLSLIGIGILFILGEPNYFIYIRFKFGFIILIID